MSSENRVVHEHRVLADQRYGDGELRQAVPRGFIHQVNAMTDPRERAASSQFADLDRGHTDSLGVPDRHHAVSLESEFTQGLPMCHDHLQVPLAYRHRYANDLIGAAERLQPWILEDYLALHQG